MDSSDSSQSSLVEGQDALTDYPFVAVMGGVVHSPSPVAAVSLLNAFIAALSLGAPEQTAQSLHQVDSAYERSGLLDE